MAEIEIEVKDEWVPVGKIEQTKPGHAKVKPEPWMKNLGCFYWREIK